MKCEKSASEKRLKQEIKVLLQKELRDLKHKLTLVCLIIIIKFTIAIISFRGMVAQLSDVTHFLTNDAFSWLYLMESGLSLDLFGADHSQASMLR